MKKKLNILLIGGPITRITSGYHVAKKGKTSPLWQKLSQIHNLQTFRWIKYLHMPISVKLVYLRDGVKIFISLARTILKGQFDVIITTGIPTLESVPAFIIAKFLGIPIVIMETHWYWPNTIISKLTWPINKFMVSHAKMVLLPGIRAKKYWESVRIPPEKLKLVPFYASVLEVNSNHIILAQEMKKKLGNRIVILYLGRLIRKKGIEYLIKAFAQLYEEFKNVVLVIAGEGPERRNLEALCSQLGLNSAVLFTGPVNEEVKPAYFLLADIYVYPSITLQLPEEWPLGVVEAMSVGKPVVVTTAVGSAPDVVKHGVNGYIIPEKDVSALYKSIKTMIEDEELRNKYGMASKKIIEEAFTYDHAVKGLEEALRQILQ